MEGLYVAPDIEVGIGSGAFETHINGTSIFAGLCNGIPPLQAMAYIRLYGLALPYGEIAEVEVASNLIARSRE